jgi:thiol-disulfide isomerase/thioredoxin
MTFRIALVLMVFTRIPPCVADTIDRTVVATVEYADLEFEPGLPEFPPVRAKLNHDAYSVEIPYGIGDVAVHVCWDQEGGRNRSILYVEYPDGGRTIKGLDFKPDSSGQFTTTTAFTSESGVEDLVPLSLRLDPTALLLSYHWTGSSSPVPGGTPTVIRESIRVLSSFPSIAFETLSGDTVRSADLAGSVVVLNWWATTCVPCIAEMPELNALAQKYETVRFVALAKDEPETVRRFLQRRQFDYEQAIGTDEHEEVFGTSYPRHVVIDPAGVVVLDRRGAGPSISSALGTVLDSLSATP